MKGRCACCGTELIHINEACPNCLSSMAERPPTLPYYAQQQPEYCEECYRKDGILQQADAELAELRKDRERKEFVLDNKHMSFAYAPSNKKWYYIDGDDLPSKNWHGEYDTRDAAIDAAMEAEDE